MLLEMLQAQEPKQVIFDFLPTAPVTFFEQAAAMDVLFARAYWRDQERTVLQHLPDGATSVAWAVWPSPKPFAALNQKRDSGVVLDGKQMITLEGTLRERFSPEASDTSITMDLSLASLPTISSQHLFAGKLPDAFFNNKIVLIAAPLSDPSSRNLWPLPGGQLVNTALFTGIALQSAVSPVLGLTIPLWKHLLLLSLVVALLAYASQVLYVRSLQKVLLSSYVTLFLVWVGLPVLFSTQLDIALHIVGLLNLTMAILFDRYRGLVEGIRQFRLDFSEMVQNNLPEAVEACDLASPRNAYFDHVDDHMFRSLRLESMLLEQGIQQLKQSAQMVAADEVRPAEDLNPQNQAV
jgi:hypothetical protein